MKNVILSRSKYQECRLFLHSSEIIFRDCGQSVIVPAWGECVANEEVCYDRKTAAQIAYTRMAREFRGVSLKWRRPELLLLDARVPQVFNGPYAGRLFYMDIKSAFAQFYKHLYLHSEWPFRRQKYPLDAIATDLWDKKIARNAVVGIARSKRNKWVRGPEVWYEDKINPFLSPTLWAQLCGLLNQVALAMLDFGAIWVNTDGYLFSEEGGWRKGQRWLETQGVAYSAGSGQGYIKALQNIYVEEVKKLASDDFGKRDVYHVEKQSIDFLTYWRKNRDGK